MIISVILRIQLSSLSLSCWNSCRSSLDSADHRRNTLWPLRQLAFAVHNGGVDKKITWLYVIYCQSRLPVNQIILDQSARSTKSLFFSIFLERCQELHRFHTGTWQRRVSAWVTWSLPVPTFQAPVKMAELRMWIQDFCRRPLFAPFWLPGSISLLSSRSMY